MDHATAVVVIEVNQNGLAVISALMEPQKHWPFAKIPGHADQ
jgi:hypothetical protein